MKKIFYVAIMLSTGLLPACKKDKNTGPTGDTFDLVRDSIFLYAKEAYYWSDALPTYDNFKPRSFTGSDELTAYTKEVNAISQFKINSVTGRPYEYSSADPGRAKYSFIDDGSSSARLNGVSGDFGFAPLYNEDNDLRIKYVYPGSPADLAGVKRGYQIMSINGRTNLTYDGTGTGANVDFVVNAYANSSTINMILKKYDGTTFTTTLNAANYTLNPVLNYKVFDQGSGHKIGYIVFNNFSSDENADPKLNQAFGEFAAQGVTDLVVDLRYNGGGFVTTSDYLTNIIAPAAKSGSLMYNTYFNSKLTNGLDKNSILVNQVRKDPKSGELYNYAQLDYSVERNAVNFSKGSVPVSLNLTRVFFIVTGSTASASELTINNLRPVMDVKLIGTTTYGKPVGFFDININKYQLYIPEFENKNSAGQGGFYSGMRPGSNDYPGFNASDDVTKDFGDPTEELLEHALNYVKTGVYTVTGKQIQSVKTKTMSADQLSEAAMQLDNDKFKGAIYNKPLNLKK
jgi:carboxyl-terminal processing protease